MKSQFVRIVLSAGLTLVGSLSLSAQDSKKAVADIPFAFQANHHSYPAGTYSLDKIGANNAGLFILTEESSRNSIFVPAPHMRESMTADPGHLSFTCSGSDCVLSQVWLPGSTIGYVRSDSSVQKDMQRKLGVSTMLNVKLAK